MLIAGMYVHESRILSYTCKQQVTIPCHARNAQSRGWRSQQSMQEMIADQFSDESNS